MRTSARWVWMLPLALGLAWTAWNGYQGLNGQDSHDYLRLAHAWSAWLSGGPRPPAAEHPPLFPLMGALLGAVIGDVHVAMRAIPIAAFLAIGGTMYWILRTTGAGSARTGAFVLLTIGAAPFLLRHALVVMSDVPGIALVALAYACTVHARSSGRRAWILVAVVLALIAVAVRYAAVPMILGALLFHASGAGQARPNKARMMFVLCAVAVMVVLVSMPVQAIRDPLQRTPLEDWNAANLFKREHRSDDGLLSYRVPNLLYVASVLAHPGFLTMGALLLPFFRRSDLDPWHVRLAAFMLGAYLLFAGGFPFQNDRVMLMAQPFVALLFHDAFVRALVWLEARRIRALYTVTVLLMLQLGLFARAIHPFMQNAKVERDLAAWVNGSGADRVYTHGMGAALTNYCPGVTVTELWYERIDRFEPGALVLVRPENLEEQWQGLRPAENWKRAQDAGVDRLLDRPDGWQVFRVR